MGQIAFAEFEPIFSNVRTGMKYASLQAAINASTDGDTIEIEATPTSMLVIYGVISKSLTIRGTGPTRPVLDAGMHCMNGKGIFEITGGQNVLIENLEFRNCQGSGSGNACGIRLSNPINVTIRNCYFGNNEDGIMGGNNNIGNVVLESCEFDNNGYGDVGQTHNIYIGACNSFIMQNCYSHNAYVGHEVKTRAKSNYILYNRITDEGSTSSYEIDIPQGGTTYIIGNVIEQSAASENPTIIAYNEETPQNPDLHLYVVNNTIVNSKSKGTFINNQNNSIPAIVQNNIFAGPGTLVNGPASMTSNWSTTILNAGFVNPMTYDYHLTSASTGAIDKSTTPSPDTGIGGFSLIPVSLYMHPLLSQDRYAVNGIMDIGAFEYGILPNYPPVVDAGTDQTVSMNGVADLSGSATDDGLPDPPGSFTYTWSKVSGPGDVTFGDPASPVTTASFSVSGVYVLQLSAYDGQLTGADTVAVTANEAPTVDAGPDQSITLPGTAALSGSGTDDGMPTPPGALSFTWHMVSGPGTVSFTSTMFPNTTASFSTAGTYVLQLDANDGAATTSDTITITVQPPLSVQIDQVPQPVYEGTSVTLHATGYSPSGDPLSYAWTQTGGRSAELTGADSDPAAYTTPIVGDLNDAAMTFEVTATDGKGGIANATTTVRAYMAGDSNHDDYVNVADLQGAGERLEHCRRRQQLESRPRRQ